MLPVKRIFLLIYTNPCHALADVYNGCNLFCGLSNVTTESEEVLVGTHEPRQPHATLSLQCDSELAITVFSEL